MNNHKRNQSLNAVINKKFQHDLSHQHLTTMDFFRLQPLACIEAVAGDKMSINVRSLVESAPLATKVYGSFHLDLHAFFVPFRLLWAQWNNYYYSNTPSEALTYSVPSIDVSKADIQSIFAGAGDTERDRRKIFGSLGYPTSQLSPEYTDNLSINPKRLVSVMPARAYQLIWWDWYRDSVSIPESNKNSFISTSSGVLSPGYATSAFAPRYRCFRKDYITTILSQASASIPGSGAEVESTSADVPTVERVYDARTLYSGTGAISGDGVYEDREYVPVTVSGSRILQTLRTPVMRGAIALQRWLERLGVTGSRPLERIVSNFGVRPEPSRLQMSELIGTKSITLNVDGLINTGASGLMSQIDAPLDGNAFGSSSESFFGTQTGRSMSSGQTDTWTYNATEHGYIMVIGSIMPNYINDGFLDPLFTRGLSAKSEGSVDFFVPEMDGTGYVPVLLSQVATPLKWNASEAWKSADIDQVVGYVPRYEDYRYIMDKISGDFNEESSQAFMRNMALVRSLPERLLPSAVVAGLNLTTPTAKDTALFDNHFQVTDKTLDHFVVNNFIVVDAEREISSAVLPTELSSLANKDLVEVARGGVRL